MKNTKIQWADDSANPVMGCHEGCELWVTPNQIISRIADSFGVDSSTLKEMLSKYSASDIYHLRHEISEKLNVPNVSANNIAAAIASSFSCYAGILHLRHGEDITNPRKAINRGYAKRFEDPKIVLGRMAAAASWSDLRGVSRPDKPWLSGLPRMIFISDMGDALSSTISFDYLRSEIIDFVGSPTGHRHIWLWLTKQPRRMAEFSRWLHHRGGIWPDNLVAMTSVTSAKTIPRVSQLKEVLCRYRGLSVEPLWTHVELPLQGIDWCIVGGQSGAYAKPFDLAWARSIISQCRKSRCAPFIKQLGAQPYDDGLPVHQCDSHGGDWDEWPDELRIREIPMFNPVETLPLGSSDAIQSGNIPITETPMLGKVGILITAGTSNTFEG